MEPLYEDLLKTVRHFHNWAARFALLYLDDDAEDDKEEQVSIELGNLTSKLVFEMDPAVRKATMILPWRTLYLVSILFEELEQIVKTKSIE